EEALHLHPRVEELLGLAVPEIGQEGLELPDQIAARPAPDGEEPGDGGEESVEVADALGVGPAHDADRAEALEVDGLAGRVELLVLFFAGRVAVEEVAGPEPARGEFVHARPGLVFRAADVDAVAEAGEVSLGDPGEVDQPKVSTQLRKEDVTVFAEETREEAQLTRLLGGDEVAAHVARRRKRLAFRDPL